MKKQPSRSAQVVAAQTPEPQSKRRQLVVGAGVATGAALAAAALGRNVQAPIASASPQPKARDGEGYRLTDHVLRYYETTRS